MMKPQWIMLMFVLVTTTAWAADPAQKPADDKAAATQSADKPAPKKEPSAMAKAGNSVKSGYHKTVKTLKKHGHKAPCSQAQKSMAQCH